MSPSIKFGARPHFLAAALMSAMPLLGHAADSPAITSTTVTLSNLRYELRDLDLNDGITPGIVFNTNAILSAANGTYASEPTTTSIHGDGLLPLSSLQVSSGQSSATTTAGGVTLIATSTLQDLQANNGGYGYNNYRTVATAAYGQANYTLADPTAPTLPGDYSAGQFTITANTAIILKGDISYASTWNIRPFLDALPADAQDIRFTGSGYGENTVARISLTQVRVSGATDEWPVSRNTTQQGGTFVLSEFYHPDLSELNPSSSFNEARSFEVSFANLQSTSQSGGVSLDLSSGNNLILEGSYALPNVLPPVVVPEIPVVPEPSTYALMGLGLAGIGLASRRRRLG